MAILEDLLTTHNPGFPVHDVHNPTLMTGINFCLACCGLAEVSTYSEGLDAEAARVELLRTSRELQSNAGRGWWFNREDSIKIAPNLQGEIVIPADVLAAHPLPRNSERIRDIVQRGTRLYHKHLRSFDLSEAYPDGVSFDLITQWDYEELPDSFRNWVIYRSAINFTAGREYFEGRLQWLQQLEQEARLRCSQEDLGSEDYNYFEQNSMASSVSGRIQGPNGQSFLGG